MSSGPQLYGIGDYKECPLITEKKFKSVDPGLLDLELIIPVAGRIVSSFHPMVCFLPLPQRWIQLRQKGQNPVIAEVNSRSQ